MKIKDIDLFYLLTFVFDSLLIFNNLLPSLLIAFLLISYIVISIGILNKSFDVYDSLLLISIAVIPTSFISVIGSSTNVFPVSWFHIAIFLLFLWIIIKNGVNKRYLLFLTLFFIYGIANSIFQPLILDAIKQVLMILLFLLSFVIGEFVVSNKTSKIYDYALHLFLLTSMSLALQIIIQFSFHKMLGIELGYIELMAGRIAYGGLLSDFSFATLYLACGSMVAIIEYFDYKRLSLLWMILIEFILLLAMLMTSARTGLFALAICLLIYFIFNIDLVNPQKIQMIIMLCGIILVPIAFLVLLKSRGGQGLFDDSGRSKGYKAAIKLFLDSPLFGTGFGLKNLTDITRLEIPHNYFIQYLSQAGIVGTILITMPIVKCIYERLRFVDNIKYVFILIVIGAMAIPDIVCSRFFYAVIILSYLSFSNSKRGELISI